MNNFLKETFSIHGRMWVWIYWKFVFVYMALYLLIGASFLFLLSKDFIWFSTLFTALIIVFIIFQIIWIFLRFKRLQDLNTSGWYAIPIWFLEFVPLFGLILWAYISFAPGTKWPNRYWDIAKKQYSSEEVL